MTQGELLAGWRRRQGWSQAVASHRLGVAQAAWAAWETGRKDPDLGNALALEFLTHGQVRAAGWPSAKRAMKAVQRRIREARRDRRKVASRSESRGRPSDRAA
jgi:transcriptional regulator with XRE-family HTH domain